MNRDLVLFVLAISVCGVLGIAVGSLPLRPQVVLAGQSALATEKRAWWRMWFPLLPSLWALAALSGWAAQEPPMADELLRPIAFAVAVPPAVLVVRAVVRAFRALKPLSASLPAVTVGLLRPRIVLSAALRRCLDETAWAAAVAHEQAHARHYDPLRIWLAQIVTDLQWPSGNAMTRLRDWHRALELARDEEARHAGVRGEDLAAAIVAATRLATSVTPSAAASLTETELDLSTRVHRLLDPLPSPPSAGQFLAFIAIAIAIAVCAISACALGLYYGDLLVRALPIIVV